MGISVKNKETKVSKIALFKAIVKANMAKNMRGSWTSDLRELPAFILGFALSIGIALVILGNFATGLGSNTAGNTVSNVIGYFNQALSTFGYIIVLMVFVVALYALLKDKKII